MSPSTGLAFLHEPHRPDPNELVLRIDPDPGRRISMLSNKASGDAMRSVHMDTSFAAELGRPPGPYERLLHDALTGDHSLFTRQDVLAAALAPRTQSKGEQDDHK